MRIKLLTLYIICLTCNLLPAQTVQWSVKPTYSSLEEYVGKLYKYRENGKVGLVDISGKVLVEAKYDSITPFIDYHALALDFQNGNYMLKGIINQNNLKLNEVPSGYFLSNDYPFFSEGKLVVYDINHKYGYLLTDGRLFVKCEYDNARPYYNSRALVLKDSERAVYLDENGNKLSTELQEGGTIFDYEYCTSFNEEGFARVGISNSEIDKVIDKSGKTIKKIKPKNYKIRKDGDCIYTEDLLPSPLEDNVFPVKDENGFFGFKIKDEVVLCVPTQFQEAFSFKDGFAKVKKNGKYGVLKLLPNVSFDGNLLQNEVNVINGKVDSLVYALKLSQQLDVSDWTLSLEKASGFSQAYSLKNNTNGKIQIAFKPNLQNKELEQAYHISLFRDDILLWKDYEKATFKYSNPSSISINKPIVKGRMPRNNGYFRANESDELEILTKINNESSEDVEIQVEVGARYKGSSEDLPVNPRQRTMILKANSSFDVEVTIGKIEKKGELEIYVKLPNKRMKRVNIIKVESRE